MTRLLWVAVLAATTVGARAAETTIKLELAPAYKIVSDDDAAGLRRVTVRIDRRLSESDLKAVSDTLTKAQKSGSSGAQIDAVAFYLPTMKLAQGPWAEQRLSSGGKITILGLRLDEEIAYRAEALSDQRPIIGMWLTSPPALPGRLTIWREKGGKTFAEWRLRSGQKTVDELDETQSSRGRRFNIAGVSGAYYLATWGGDLELGDKSSVIAVAERLVIDKAVSAALKRGPEQKPTATPGAAVSAKTQTPSASSQHGEAADAAQAAAHPTTPVTGNVQANVEKPDAGKTAKVHKASVRRQNKPATGSSASADSAQASAMTR